MPNFSKSGRRRPIENRRSHGGAHGLISTGSARPSQRTSRPRSTADGCRVAARRVNGGSNSHSLRVDAPPSARFEHFYKSGRRRPTENRRSHGAALGLISIGSTSPSQRTSRSRSTTDGCRAAARRVNGGSNSHSLMVDAPHSPRSRNFSKSGRRPHAKSRQVPRAHRATNSPFSSPSPPRQRSHGPAQHLDIFSERASSQTLRALSPEKARRAARAKPETATRFARSHSVRALRSDERTARR